MSIAKKSIRAELPTHTLVSVNWEDLRSAAHVSLDEALDAYETANTMSEEDLQIITTGVERFLTEDPKGKTLRSFNMPVIAGAVAWKYCNVENPETFSEKVKAYVRGDRERFYVARGRSSERAGGVIMLQRVSEKERNALLAKREAADKAEQEEESAS